MAMSMGSGKRVMAEINITPFTDVCLVLLIIFMVSASFMGAPKGMDVKLPSANPRATGDLPPRDITITLGKSGELFVEEQRVTFPQLYQDLHTYAHNNKIRNVIIKADKSVLYDQVVRVMDAVRETGCNYMSLAVQQNTQPQPNL